MEERLMFVLVDAGDEAVEIPAVIDAVEEAEEG